MEAVVSLCEPREGRELANAVSDYLRVISRVLKALTDAILRQFESSQSATVCGIIATWQCHRGRYRV